MTTYRRIEASELIERLPDGARIPPDPGNIDYQAFLAWEVAGGVIEEASPAAPAPAPLPLKDRLAAAGIGLDELREALLA